MVTPGQIDSLVAGFARTWQRPPSETELKGLLDDYVNEEMATRDAMAMGLDRDDTIIRRRLRQKLEFVAEDSIDATPPTDAELQAWLRQHPDKVAHRAAGGVPAGLFERGAARAIAHSEQSAKLLAQLAAGGPDVDLAELGDSLMVPSDVATRTTTRRGPSVRRGIRRRDPQSGAATVGRSDRVLLRPSPRAGARASEATPPSLGEIRPLVEREVLSERRKKALDSMYDEMLARTG